MFRYIRNPSPAMRKRLFAIGLLKSCSSDINNQIADMKIIKDVFNIIDTMNFEKVLFHGYNSIESLAKILTEYGIDKDEPHYKRILELVRQTDNNGALFTRGITKVGKYVEDKGYSASVTIKASLLASSGFDSHPDVIERIEHSLKCFKAVLDYGSIYDFAVKKSDTWVYKEGKLFPDYYNFRVLAFSKSWKNVHTIEMMVKAFERLCRLQPIPNVYIPYKGQLIAPGSYLMHEIDTDFIECNDDKKAEWLIRNEYLARMGLLRDINTLKKVNRNLDNVENMIESIKNIKRPYSFTKWGAYSGISLENDWRKEERKVNDIAFRIGLIDYYSNLGKSA